MLWEITWLWYSGCPPCVLRRRSLRFFDILLLRKYTVLFKLYNFKFYFLKLLKLYAEWSCRLSLMYWNKNRTIGLKFIFISQINMDHVHLKKKLSNLIKLNYRIKLCKGLKETHRLPMLLKKSSKECRRWRVLPQTKSCFTLQASD